MNNQASIHSILTEVDWDPVDAAVAAEAETAFRFLERLVGAPSTVGREQIAQDIVAEELTRLGFRTEPLTVPDFIAADPAAGVPQGPYERRYNVLGRLAAGPGPVLLLNGHIDVVPAETGPWSSAPYAATRTDGWLVGRGAGDMKGGFAMGTLAIAALARAMPDALAVSPLWFLSVIEEECTGNGTLAAARQGVLGDAVVLLEPSGLDLLLGGVGILWIDIEIAGRAAHAESADRAVNPVQAAFAIVQALGAFEHAMNAEEKDPALAAVAHPYNVNVGTMRAGDWRSSVPPTAQLGVRIGFPRSWSPDEALRRVREVVAEAARDDAWLREHPPVVHPTGFRAEGYLLAEDHPLAEALAAAHADAHGVPPKRVVLGSTTDARFYLNQFGCPAIAYGPRTRNIHGVDEAVELASIVEGARTLARFIASWALSGGLLDLKAGRA